MYITVGVTVHRALEGLQIVYLTFLCWHLALEAYDCTKSASDPIFYA